MNHLRVRCPACEKLYQVETEAIYSLTPHFECRACNAVFAFDYPPVDSENVAAFLVGPNDLQAQESSSVRLQAQPSLVQLWNKIFDDYDDHELHDDFIKRCRELEALSFAKLKYENLQTAMGTDPVCEKYLRQIEALLNVKAEISVSKPLEVDHFWMWLKSSLWMVLKKVTIKKAVYWAPLMICLPMIVIGFSNLAMRNMIGTGIMIGFLSYGLITFFRGRIRLSDFID